MDAPNSQDQLLPQPPDSVTSISALGALDATSFAAVLPHAFANTEDRPDEPDYWAKLKVLIRRHISEPSVISAISTVLRQTSNSYDEFLTISAAKGCLFELPEDQLVPYRPALVDLSNIDNGSSNPIFTGFLALQAKDMIRFIDDRTAVWTPAHKMDDMAERTLLERVHTAEEMQPHVPGLLGWLQDVNWPPYSGCEEQLARFPELAVDEIYSTFMALRDRADGEWTLNMLRFVEGFVPVGSLWEKLYPQVREMMDNPSGDMEESGLLEYIPDWIRILDNWRNNRQTS